jgi:hypothetical protein
MWVRWDDVAIRDIIAAVVYALHVRHETPVDEVPWSRVLWWLWDDEHVITLVEDGLPDAAQALTTPGDELSDPFLARWRWLNRTWDPQAPREAPQRAAPALGDLDAAAPRRRGRAQDGAAVGGDEPRDRRRAAGPRGG